RLGLRLRLRVELARRLHRLPPPQDRGRRPPPPDPHRPGRRLRVARGMSFRTRLTLAAAIAVAVALAVASAVSYAVVRNQLPGSVDASLGTRVSTRFLRSHVDPASGKPVIDMPPPLLGAAPGYTQLVSKQGQTILQENEPVPLPVTDRVKAAAAGASAPFFFDARVQGTHVRILPVPLGAGFAVESSRPLAD